jgi:RpiR family transcriptional regulator, repressor of rpiB and als operon
MNMNIDPRKVGPRIRMMMPDMSPAEMRITEVLLEQAGEDEVPIKQVAIKADVSEAAVVKTAKRLGYAGYRELRSALFAYSQQPHADLHQDVGPDDTAEMIVQKVFQTSVQALQETLAILDIEGFKFAADLIHKARQLDFYGLGGSAQIARDVAHKFLRIGVRATVYDDTHMMAMSASLLGPGDVVIAFSHSGRSSGVVEAVRIAKQNRCRIITLSNYDASVLAKLSDVVLLSTARGSPLTSENAAARIAQLNIMDAIFIAVAQKSYSLAEKNLERTMGAVQTKWET